MNLRIVVCLALVLAIAIAALPSGPAKPALEYPIVRLHTIYDNSFFCSGTVISDEYVLTAAHCVSDFPTSGVYIKVVGVATVARASVQAFHGRSDLALIRGDFRRFAKYPIEVSPGRIVRSFDHSKKLITCGFPHAGRLYCNSFIYKNQSMLGIMGYTHLWPGMSGGPVMDMETGRIIAVNTGITGDEFIVSPLVELWEVLHVKPSKSIAR